MRLLEKTHPLTTFCYLLAVLAITIFCRNPVIIAESLVGSLFAAGLSGKLRGALWLVLMAALVAVTNPIFSHNGVTVLFFVGDTAFTLEALFYGIVFGVMLSAAVLWCASAARFMTSDKYIWLFGRILPSSGLVLSCSMRFVPLFIRRTAEFASARGASSLKDYLKAFSSSVSYSAEEAMSSADSMKSRGYGSAKRSFYSNYSFGYRDFAALVVILICGAGSVILLAAGTASFCFYPAVSRIRLGFADTLLYVLFGILCMLPALAEVRIQIAESRIQ